MGWLQDLLAGQGTVALPPAALFPGEMTEAEQAAAARQAAATALGRSGRRQLPRGPGDMAGQDSVPYSAGMLSPYGLNWPSSEPPAASPAVAATAQQPPTAPDMPPSTNDPMSGEPVLFRDGVQLTRASGLGSPMSLAPSAPDAMAQGEVPPAAAPTAATAPAPVGPAGEPAQGGLMEAAGGILGKIFNPANAPLLLAMGGGFAGAPSLGTGMRRGFSAAAPQAALLRKEQVAEGGIAQSYRALVARGVNPQEALAAVRNPDIMKAVVAKYFETKPLTVHMIKDAIGGETPVVFNPTTGRVQDMTGRPVSQESAASGSVPGSGVPGGVLAPGVTFDPNATGDAYLNQFNDDVKASVRAYMNGDVQPSGNPRQRTIANFAKTVAQRYGQDTGTPVSDALFSERRQYRQQLGSNSATAAGGQAKAFNQGIEHAHALADQLVKLGNVDPIGVPGVSRGLNWMRETFSTKQAGIAAEARTIGQTLAGEVGKLFSGSAGGGVHEREMTRERFKTISSPTELAAALSGTLETMEGGLKALEQRRDQILGPNNNVQFVSPETREKIAHIREIIAQLKGERSATPAAAPAAAPAATTAAPAPGRYVLDPASGRLVPQR